MAKYSIAETFLTGSTTTGIVKINDRVLTGIIITGSVITGTKITFLVSTDGTNFYSLYDSDSSEVSITTASYARGYNLKPTVFLPWNYVKGRLGTSASAVAQAGNNAGVEFIMDSM